MKLLTVSFIKIFVVLVIFGFLNTTATAQQTDPTWTAIGHPATRLNTLIGSGAKLIAGNIDKLDKISESTIFIGLLCSSCASC